MRLLLKSSGGFGGLSIERQLDTADLAPDLARRTKQHLSSSSLRAVRSMRSLSMPDAQQYEIHILPEKEDGKPEYHVVDDMCPRGEILDLIDELMAATQGSSPTLAGE